MMRGAVPPASAATLPKSGLFDVENRIVRINRVDHVERSHSAARMPYSPAAGPPLYLRLE